MKNAQITITGGSRSKTLHGPYPTVIISRPLGSCLLSNSRFNSPKPLALDVRFFHRNPGS